MKFRKTLFAALLSAGVLCMPVNACMVKVDVNPNVSDNFAECNSLKLDSSNYSDLLASLYIELEQCRASGGSCFAIETQIMATRLMLESLIEQMQALGCYGIPHMPPVPTE